MVNFGPLAAEIGLLLVWGTPANFNGFRVLALLVQRCRSTEANQTLHDVWPSPGLVHSIYIFGGSCPATKFFRCKIHFRTSLAFSYIVSAAVTARHWSSGRQPNFAALSRGRHLYLAGRPSRWALAHILVFTARRSYASAVLGVVILSVRPFVCLSVCPSVTRVLCD